MFVHGVERISFLLLGFILFGVPVHAAPHSGGQPSAGPPNIVLIVLDACREDRIDATRNGVPVMPYLSNFPAVRFRKAVSSAPWTTPAMVSIFTSLYVDTHQVHSPVTQIPENLESMATYLKEAGYATLCFQTNSLVHAQMGLGRDFDVYDFQVLAPGDKVTALALAHVADATPPFFLYAHYMDTHAVYWPPESYRTLMGYPNPGLGSEEQAYVEGPFSYILDNNFYVSGYKLRRGYPEASAIMKEALRILYDSAARFADEQSGILIDTLLARYPNTVVVVVADHGEHFWEHGYLGHTVSLYEPLIHVPLFVKAPGRVPATVDSLVETVDILPTIAALTGLPARPTWQGRDLFAPRDPLGPVFSSGKYTIVGPTGESEMVRLDSMKLICNKRLGSLGLLELAMKLICGRRLDPFELYDLAADPGETTNLASTQPVVTEQLVTLVYAHLRTNALANGSDGPVTAKPARSSTEEGLEIDLTAGAGTGHRWFKNGQLIAEDAPRIVGTNTSMLAISPLRIDDTGDYECVYRAATKAQCLQITDPFALQVLEKGFPVRSVLIAAVLVCAALACFRLWKRAST